MSAWRWGHLEALFPTDTWASGKFIPVGTPRQQKLWKILSGTLQGMAVALWKVFKQSFKYHWLQFHRCIWDKRRQGCWWERDSLTFMVPCWAWPAPPWANWWSGQGVCLAQNQPTPKCILFFPSESSFWVCLTVHANTETAETPGTERTSETTNSFQQSCYPGQFKMIMKQQPEICLKLFLSEISCQMLLSSSVHRKESEKTVLIFKKMLNFNTGCSQRTWWGRKNLGSLTSLLSRLSCRKLYQ